MHLRLEDLPVIASWISIALHVVSFFFVMRLRTRVPPAVWDTLICTNVLELARRFVRLYEDSALAAANASNGVASAVLAATASIVICLACHRLASYAKTNQRNIMKMSMASRKLAVDTHSEASLAYQLAMHFIRMHEERDREAREKL